MNNKKIVNMKDMLIKARTFNYAVAQFNTNNFEWTAAILEAAQESRSPVIIGVSEGATKYMWGFKNVVDMVNNMIIEKNITVPVAVHLDHGSYEACVNALEAGFSSVMFDGSSLPIADNLIKSDEIIKLAKKFNASVETEVGGIGGTEDGKTSTGEIANIEECLMMSKLPVDALAVAVGSVHGIYPKNWKSLDFELLSNVSSLISIPLVLHGGTGIPNDQIKRAIINGVSKINVNTECQLAFAKATREYIKKGYDQDLTKKGYDPRKLLAPGKEAIKRVCIEKFKEFGSYGIIKD